MDTEHVEPRHKMTVKVIDALRTIQGYTLAEYQQARTELMDDLQADLELVQMAKAVGNAAPLVGGGTVAAAPAAAVPTAPPAPAAGGWGKPNLTPVPSFTQATTPSCQHGPRTARSGVGAKGPWKAWFCPTQKGDPTQCEGIFVKRGTPEWDAFPA